MTEKEWVNSITTKIGTALRERVKDIRVVSGYRLPYSSEIITYEGKKPLAFNQIGYETDILVYENLDKEKWRPRIIIETKINSITTHDAITYSQKAQTHKQVHPYLRYGILIGNREHHPLPGRLFRHGQHFDFMQSWKGFVAEENEWQGLISMLVAEIEASKTLEEILFNSRSRTRKKYSMLHRPLVLSGNTGSNSSSRLERNE